MQISYFGYFGHAWLCTPKMIVSTRRKNRCISLCQRWTSSFTFFLRYYILKNLVIWMADNILDYNSRTRILPIWDWWWNINNNISFQFWLFPRKTNDRIFQKKSKKNPFWAILGTFFQMWAKINSPGKKGPVRF